MTTDHIEDGDWERVRELAAQVADAACRDDHGATASGTRQLLAWLEELERKYGPKPSILATKADYREATREQVALLVQAWSLAEAIGDKANLVMIASSLASRFVDDIGDRREALDWLARLDKALTDWPDADERSEYVRMRNQLASIESREGRTAT